MSLNSGVPSETENQTKIPPKPLRGFARLSPEQRKKIAAKGGSRVPAHKRAFSTHEGLARKAGMTGGRSVPSNKRTFSTNVALAVEAGRKGGRKSSKRKVKLNEQVD